MIPLHQTSLLLTRHGRPISTCRLSIFPVREIAHLPVRTWLVLGQPTSLHGLQPTLFVGQNSSDCRVGHMAVNVTYRQRPTHVGRPHESGDEDQIGEQSV